MNQQQRKFLIEKIEGATRDKIRELESEIPKEPSPESYIVHEILSGTFDIKDKDSLKENVLQRTLALKENQTILSGSDRWGRRDINKRISFAFEDFFITPERYSKDKKEYDRIYKEKQEEIKAYKDRQDTLTTRIQLSSNKLLEKLISEIDDFGDLSLFDTKLKLIPGEEPKKLN